MDDECTWKLRDGPVRQFVVARFGHDSDHPSGQGYHWNSNAETYYLIGEAMGEAMQQLVGAK